MAAATIPLIGELGLKDDKFNQALARNQQKFRQFSSEAGKGLSGAFAAGGNALKSFGGMAAGVFNGLKNAVFGLTQALGLGGLLSTAGIMAGIKDIADLGGRLSDTSARTGIAVKDLVILEEQFRQAGIGADQATNYVRRMNEALLDGKKADLFKAMGLDAASLLRSSPQDALNKILGQIRQIGSTAQQQKALSNIFGARQGVMLMTIVTDPDSFAKAQQMVGGMSELMNKNANALDRISDNLWGGIPVKIRQAFLGFTDALIDPLLEATKFVESIDFTNTGQKLGEQLMWAWDIFSGLVKNENLMEYIGERLRQGFIWALSYLAGGLSVLFKNLLSPENLLILKSLMGYVSNSISAAAAEINPFRSGQAESFRESAKTQLDSALSLIPTMIPVTGARIMQDLGDIKPLESMTPSLVAATRRIEDLHAAAGLTSGVSLMPPVQSMRDLAPVMQPLRTPTERGQRRDQPPQQRPVKLQDQQPQVKEIRPAFERGLGQQIQPQTQVKEVVKLQDQQPQVKEIRPAFERGLGQQISAANEQILKDRRLAIAPASPMPAIAAQPRSESPAMRPRETPTSKDPARTEISIDTATLEQLLGKIEENTRMEME
jgi:hypothetical protein